MSVVLKKCQKYKIIKKNHRDSIHTALIGDNFLFFLWQCLISLELQNGRQLLPSMHVRVTSSVDQNVLSRLTFCDFSKTTISPTFKNIDYGNVLI